MTKEELMVLLRDPDQTGQAVDELNRQIESNPYFHTGHQLYLKGLQQTDERKMALQLNKTALSVRDRAVLYNYINRPSIFRKEPLSTDRLEEETEVPFVPGSSYVSSQFDHIHHIQYALSESSPPGQDLLTAGAEYQESEAHIISEEKIMSDDQLLNVIRQRLEQIDPPQTEPTSDIDAGLEICSQKSATGDLIDSFLKANPKIIPGNSRYEADLSAGMQESNENATETLADIYAAQGHKDKAIEIYQQLILKYPEKHIYFAAQIDRLKEIVKLS